MSSVELRSSSRRRLPAAALIWRSVTSRGVLVRASGLRRGRRLLSGCSGPSVGEPHRGFGRPTRGRDSYPRIGYLHDRVFVGNGPLSRSRASTPMIGSAHSALADRSSRCPVRVLHRAGSPTEGVFEGGLVVHGGQAP